MKEFLIIVSVFVGLALATELAYIRCLSIVNKMHFYTTSKKTVRRLGKKNVTFIGRPELDFDLHIRKVDKIRFGDET